MKLITYNINNHSIKKYTMKDMPNRLIKESINLESAKLGLIGVNGQKYQIIWSFLLFVYAR